MHATCTGARHVLQSGGQPERRAVCVSEARIDDALEGQSGA